VERPLLLIDIDGVISLFGFDPARPPAGSFLAVEGIIHFLSARAGDQLRRLEAEFELAWCSGWEEKANEHLPVVLGLPGHLPHLSFEMPRNGAGPQLTRAHWKLAAIDAFAGSSRPLAWIDDTHDAATEAWATTRPGATLLVRTEPAVGLTDEHVAALLDWAAALPAAARLSPGA
jgi:HAD domain in Swiss Army Knife RNA repair proteins